MIGTTPTRRSGSPGDRAVSDVLAFILVFSIIITSVGLVYVFGMGALGDAQVSEQNRNAERAFETMAVSFSDLQDGRGVERLSQLNPRGGGVGVDDGPRVTVTVGGDTLNDGGGDPLGDGSVGSLNYAHEGTEVSYELGATFRADDGHSVMVRPPEFVCTTSGSGPDRAIVSYTNLSATEPSSVSTSSTLRIRATREDSEFNRSGGDLNVTIEDSTHADAWERYFDENGWSNVEGPSDGVDHVEATCETDGSSATAYVRETELEIELLL